MVQPFFLTLRTFLLMKQYNSDELTALVQEYIRELNYVKEPKGLYEPIKHVLDLGGKRIRPVLLLLAYNLWKEDVSNALAPAAAVEVFHNFTLLHDDLMDGADLRRNQPTVHKKWNPNTAILSGDMMLIMAYQWMVESCPADRLGAVMEAFIQVSGEVCEGQQWDMDFEHRNDVEVSDYMEMIRLKTSVLLAASLKIGAILAGATSADAQHLYDFGIRMGLAFQLQDDWLDVYADSKVFGKKIGGDIVANKKTFLLLSARQQLTGQDKVELERWIASPSFEREEKVQAVTALYEKAGISTLCQQRIAEIYRSGFSFLDRVTVSPEKKQYLCAYVESLMNRIV